MIFYQWDKLSNCTKTKTRNFNRSLTKRKANCIKVKWAILSKAQQCPQSSRWVISNRPKISWTICMRPSNTMMRLYSNCRVRWGVRKKITRGLSTNLREISQRSRKIFPERPIRNKSKDLWNMSRRSKSWRRRLLILSTNCIYFRSVIRINSTKKLILSIQNWSNLSWGYRKPNNSGKIKYSARGGWRSRIRICCWTRSSYSSRWLICRTNSTIWNSYRGKTTTWDCRPQI